MKWIELKTERKSPRLAIDQRPTWLAALALLVAGGLCILLYWR